MYSCEFCEIFKSTYFVEHLSLAASVYGSGYIHYVYYNRKKWKDNLETRAELTVLRANVRNQVTLEPIVFCRASKCKQTKEQDI